MPAKSIRAIILENEAAPKPLRPRDLAALNDIKLQSLHRCRARLRKEGVLAPARGQGNQRRSATQIAKRVAAMPKGKRIPKISTELAAAAAGWTEKDVAEVASSTVMSEKERLNKLSLMGRFAPDVISIAAIKALEDLGRAKGSSVGPPKPLTEDEQIVRLGRLLRALGREVSERAFRATFEEKPVPEAITEANVELQTQIGEEHPRTPDGDSSVGGLPAPNGA